MVNTNKLKARIVEKGITIETLAKDIGINRSTLYRKLNAGGDDFSIKDIRRITDSLQMTFEEAIPIFFEQNVAYDATNRDEPRAG